MAILDFLKSKKEAEKSRKSAKKPFDKAQGKPAKKVSATSVRQSSESEGDKKREEITKKPASAKSSSEAKKFSYDAVKQPHISEKATGLSEKDQYTFEVAPNYNKHEIKDAVEGIYGVDVLSVNIIKIPAKKRRLGRTEGFRKSFKKAIVKIKEGQKIEIL
ncbi:MAG: 50S ribosomal protein L23 [Candidatus Staskawiczbacteria bacterium]|jgi:large subunit ribosomal protein L23